MRDDDREIHLVAIDRHMEGRIMSALDDLNATLTKLSTDVDTLLALHAAADQTPGIVAANTVATAIDAKVEAVTNPTPVTTPTDTTAA